MSPMIRIGEKFTLCSPIKFDKMTLYSRPPNATVFAHEGEAIKVVNWSIGYCQIRLENPPRIGWIKEPDLVMVIGVLSTGVLLSGLMVVKER